jgi:hypothetical protein
MEIEGSLPCSKGLASGSYPEPDASSPQLPTLFPIPSTPRSSEWSFRLTYPFIHIIRRYAISIFDTAASVITMVYWIWYDV